MGRHRPEAIPSREITAPQLVVGRRELLRAAGVALAAAALPQLACADEARPGAALPGVRPGPFSTDEERTPFADAARYNNFYELGTAKDDSARNADKLRTQPWSVVIDGEEALPGSALSGVSFDANGNVTVAGVATIDPATGDLVIAAAATDSAAAANGM